MQIFQGKSLDGAPHITKWAGTHVLRDEHEAGGRFRRRKDTQGDYQNELFEKHYGKHSGHEAPGKTAYLIEQRIIPKKKWMKEDE